MTVRVFKTSDLERVMQINSKCLPENYSSYFYRDLYTKYPETFMVAELVDAHRRKGIGKELIVQAMARGRRIYDCDEGYLEVRISNEPAIGLYDKLGFSKVKRNYGYYLDGEDAWVMASSLENY